MALGRRTFLKLLAMGLGAQALGPFVAAGGVLARAADGLAAPGRTVNGEADLNVSLSHPQFQANLESIGDLSDRRTLIASIRRLLLDTAWSCVVADGRWVVPSRAYYSYLYARDSFWVLAALNDTKVTTSVVDRLRQDRAGTADGRIATALARDPKVPPRCVRDDESTMMYLLQNYLLQKLGGKPDRASLLQAYGYLLPRIRNGRYFTAGESQAQGACDSGDATGAFHYWADTYRPTREAKSASQVVSYNQGLLCVTLRCLQAMGIGVDDRMQAEVESAYANVVNPVDRASIPQREGSDVVDVSALVGEALSLYFFDRPLLSAQRMRATFYRFLTSSAVRYRDGSFLGFKVISGFDGNYRPSSEFLVPETNAPGSYHNGGSWLLYDALALYAAARRGIEGASELFVQRLASEIRRSRASHEFLITHWDDLGGAVPERDGYGWNGFVANLLPSLGVKATGMTR